MNDCHKTIFPNFGYLVRRDWRGRWETPEQKQGRRVSLKSIVLDWMQNIIQTERQAEPLNSNWEVIDQLPGESTIYSSCEYWLDKCVTLQATCRFANGMLGHRLNSDFNQVLHHGKAYFPPGQLCPSSVLHRNNKIAPSSSARQTRHSVLPPWEWVLSIRVRRSGRTTIPSPPPPQRIIAVCKVKRSPARHLDLDPLPVFSSNLTAKPYTPWEQWMSNRMGMPFVNLEEKLRPYHKIIFLEFMAEVKL